jgi:hypothetical protein
MNQIKRFLFLFPAIAVLLFLLLPSTGKAQVLNETTKKRIAVGIGLFTDIWQNVPSDVKTRTINQGFQAVVLYGVPFGKSNFGFGIGLGLSVHNMYGNFAVTSKNDTTRFTLIPDSLSYKRSKMTLPYLELPIEFHFATKKKFAVGLGFKLGYLLPAFTKYVGDNPIPPHEELRMKLRNLKNLENFAYGPYMRIGYKWFHMYGYWQLSHVFKKGLGPDVYPITVGFLLRPF